MATFSSDQQNSVHKSSSSADTQTSLYKNAQQYAQALRPWLWHYQNMCVMQTFASHFALQTAFSGNRNVTPQASLNPPGLSISNPPLNQRPLNGVNITPTPLTQQNYTDRQANGRELPGVALRVPTFWKRFAAELIDFTFLFYIKMTVSLCLMTEFSFDQLSFLNSEDMLDSFSELDYDRAFAITYEVIALEILNRILITIFETLCLYRPVGGRPGVGATPGKRLLGLKVVSCDHVESLGQGQVLVSPAGNVSLKNAFLRSLIKNFTIALFLPACLTLFFFKHNRAAYDIVAHTIVVEDIL
ncbi:protein FAM8A1-like [Physella acuta]|uniref:protein FAM8A1-like n=1 Tax=Physella acuta TaxID=109671 RepID=UPI0027DCD8DF|nr:protein FAM8A1-like [Physella acuta]